MKAWFEMMCLSDRVGRSMDFSSVRAPVHDPVHYKSYVTLPTLCSFVRGYRDNLGLISMFLTNRAMRCVTPKLINNQLSCPEPRVWSWCRDNDMKYQINAMQVFFTLYDSL